MSEVRHTADCHEAREEKTRVIENRLFIAEKNRLAELERRLAAIKRHVGVSGTFSYHSLMLFNVYSNL